MLNKEIINKTYVDFKVYSVVRLKDKYGFRVILRYDDGSEEMRQIGGFSKKSDANKERNNTIADLTNHTYIVLPKIKFKDFIIYWLTIIMKPNIKYNSYLSYRNVIMNYAIPFFGNLYLSQINIGHIQKFYNQTAKKYKSISRLAKPVMVNSLGYAKDRNLIKTNPAISVNLPKCVEDKPYKVLEIDVDKTLTIEQVKILIEASKTTPIYLQILFAVLMGLRKQEINGLKYTDIDFINRKLYLQRQLGIDPNKSKNDCDKKTYTKQEIELKSFNSERILDIPDLVFEAILEEKKKYEKNRNRRINDKNNPFLDSNYICCSTYGHSRSKGFHVKYYKKLLKDNNLPNIRFHDLRHTFATLLLMNNYNLKAVSQLLGHSSTIITANVYFDKNKIIVDCNDELNHYINRVKPKEEDCLNKRIINDLDTNLSVSRYIEYND